jgi:hypothetical protein
MTTRFRQMLVKLYGVRSGSVRLLVVGSKTYVLPQDDSDGRCVELGDTGWRPLPRDWLAQGAQCVGSAPLSETSVQWWKTPAQVLRPVALSRAVPKARRPNVDPLFLCPQLSGEIRSPPGLRSRGSRRVVPACQAGATVRPICATQRRHCHGQVARESRRRHQTPIPRACFRLPGCVTSKLA